MRINRTIIFGTVVAIGASLTAWLAHSQANSGIGITPVTYDLIVSTFPLGKPANVQRQARAVRSDGSSVNVQRLMTPTGASFELSEISDLQKMLRIAINRGSETTTTVGINHEEAVRLLEGPPSSCGLPDSSKKAMKAGHRAIQVVQSITRKSSLADAMSTKATREIERWLALDLNCVVLEETVRENGRVLETRIAENIRMGEPDVALFIVPPSYQEASPMEMERRLAQRYGYTQSSTGTFETRVEQAYAKRQAELQARELN